MLVISRKQGESIKVAENIEIVVISVDGQRVRLGVQAPRNIRVLRAELDPSIVESNQTAAVKVKPSSASELLKAAASAQKKKKGAGSSPA